MTIRAYIHSATPLSQTVRALELRPAEGETFPPFTAGAHIKLHTTLGDGRPGLRSYSLINSTDQRGQYEIAVQREPNGSGGSVWVHGLAVGDKLSIEAPENLFPLETRGATQFLIAGGIGITPILSMARELSRAGAEPELHYVCRAPERMVFREEIGALPKATLYFDGGDPAKGLPLAQMMQRIAPEAHVYVCGPKPLIEATLAAGRAAGIDEAHLHYEMFDGVLSGAGDAAFEVVLGQSGETVEVPAGMSILDAMIEAGHDPLYDCRRGDCGVCASDLIEGEADHRDICLSAGERASGRICICVSRAKSRRLVIDL